MQKYFAVRLIYTNFAFRKSHNVKLKNAHTMEAKDVKNVTTLKEWLSEKFPSNCYFKNTKFHKSRYMKVKNHPEVQRIYMLEYCRIDVCPDRYGYKVVSFDYESGRSNTISKSITIPATWYIL